MFPSSSDPSPGSDPARVLTGLVRDRFGRPNASGPLTPEIVSVEDSSRGDPMASFDAESEIAHKDERPERAEWRLHRLFLVVFAIVACVAGVVLAAGYAMARRSEALAAIGEAQFDSRPSGAEVVVDGEARGKTPLKISLPVGEHSVEIKGESGTRSLPLIIQPAVLVSQYIELGPPTRRGTGRLEVTSSPVGANVRVNGAARGVTPIVLDNIEARIYTVVLSRGTATVSRTVRISANGTASVFAALDSEVVMPGSIGGFVSLRAPFEMQIFEDGRLIGTTSAERLMLPAGRHQLELASSGLQFRTTMTLDVRPGRDTSLVVPVPNGEISVNALPWAEVLIDGRPVGTTPLANLSVPIGDHEIVWRHPELGERRQTVTVASSAPARIGMDFASP
jgi:serine/threonine-protein kinase